jgi:hypothetical protein
MFSWGMAHYFWYILCLSVVGWLVSYCRSKIYACEISQFWNAEIGSEDIFMYFFQLNCDQIVSVTGKCTEKNWYKWMVGKHAHMTVFLYLHCWFNTHFDNSLVIYKSPISADVWLAFEHEPMKFELICVPWDWNWQYYWGIAPCCVHIHCFINTSIS